MPEQSAVESPVRESEGAAGSPQEAPAQVPLLTEPRGGVPDVVEDERRLVSVARALGEASGPMAVDAERASGYRYGQRAYLVQLWREGAGTVLIDPIACPDLSPIAEATAGVEWVLHAANQDLPCLAEVGMRPERLFDTEVGSRLLGLPRVGLSTVLEHYFSVRLAKEHSAVDWSTRPLPHSWLTYASLDVELLVALRDAVAADLSKAGKLEWAQQEFDALTRFTGPPVRTEPWRRTGGMHKVRNRRATALVRELWLARDRLASGKDIAPGRILPDAALIDLALAGMAKGPQAVAASRHKLVKRHAHTWRRALEVAFALPDSELPLLTVRSDAPPPVKAWKEKNPVAADRLALVKADVAAFAAEHELPVENVLTPDTLRRLMWDPVRATDEAVREALQAKGARPWQIDAVAPIVLRAYEQVPGQDSDQRPEP